PARIDDVVLGGDVAAPPVDGGVAAGEHEPAQLHRGGHLEHVAQPVDVGAKQRGRVAQPGAGVDHAVVDDIAAGHRLGQGGGVEDVAVKTGDVEVVDAAGVGAVPHHDPDLGVAVGGDQRAGHVRAEEPV